jgi:hypothetical protein
VGITVIFFLITNLLEYHGIFAMASGEKPICENFEDRIGLGVPGCDLRDKSCCVD